VTIPDPTVHGSLTPSIRGFQLEYAKALARSAASADMLPVDATALTIIFDEPSCTPSYLARSLTMSGGAVTSLVDRLLHLGLVTRKRRETDRRSVDLTLTPAGSELSIRLRRHADDVMNRSMHPEDRAAIVDYLDRATVMLADATNRP
jgi:DNA-binding MarR family transcriptional regulator